MFETEYLGTLEENETVTVYRHKAIIVRRADYESDGITTWDVWIDTLVMEPLGYVGTYYRSEQQAIEAGKEWIRQHPNAKPKGV